MSEVLGDDLGLFVGGDRPFLGEGAGRHDTMLDMYEIDKILVILAPPPDTQWNV